MTESESELGLSEKEAPTLTPSGTPPAARSGSREALADFAKRAVEVEAETVRQSEAFRR